MEGSMETDSDRESSGEEYSSSDASELEIGLDQNGRIYPGVDGNPNYGFRSVRNFLTGDLKALKHECEKVFSAKNAKSANAYSYGETFFVPANTESPSCSLESLALQIFQFHAKDVTGYDPENSGAEWWTLVLNSEDSVGWHWDKDYGLEDRGVNIFPHIGTVTYLSGGAPTVVTQKRAPPYSDEDQVDMDPSYCGPAGDTAIVSCPEIGKHISFDGRYLHGALPELLPLFGCADSDASEQRITFLVNIWFNHLPRDSVRIDGRLTRRLLKEKSLWLNSQISEDHLKSVIVSKDNHRMNKTEFKVLHESKYDYAIMMPLPSVENVAEKGSSILLTFHDCAPVVVKVQE